MRISRGLACASLLTVLPGVALAADIDGSTLSVLIAGEPRETFTRQSFPKDATRVGLVSPSQGETGEFDDLVATVLAPS